MPPNIHGTKTDPAKHHPVYDLEHWEAECPLGENREEGWNVDSPADLARVEQARRLALGKGDLGPSVASDVFVWSDARDSNQPWLTRIGGVPWRERDRAWPKDPYGMPLTFLGQVCFLDSTELLPFELPGAVALIFGTRSGSGWISIEEGGVLEWSSLYLDEPLDYLASGQLPCSYQGVRHRTLQWTDPDAYELAFETAGFKEGGFGIGAIQATSIGTYADLPQGWPFADNDGRTLVATLSSVYFSGEWPLCDVPAAAKCVGPDGRSNPICRANDALSFGIGDAGCIWIYRDRDGNFKLDTACG